MSAIDSTDLAILSARMGCARFGASRFGFCPDDVEGPGTTEPGEYVWSEEHYPETTWTLDPACIGPICGRGTFTAPPVAAFSSNSPVSLGQDMNFVDESTGDIVSWSWDFGDGIGTSTLQNPTYQYGGGGNFDVTLTVTGPGGTNFVTHTVGVVL
jgi:PKD repeat protein